MPPLLAPNFADEEAVARGAAAGWVSFHLQWLGAFVPVKSERRGETGPLALVCLVNHVTRCCSCVSLIEMIEMAPRKAEIWCKVCHLNDLRNWRSKRRVPVHSCQPSMLQPLAGTCASGTQ